MSTIIDSLIMTLGLDSRDYDAGSKKVEKGLKDTGSTAEITGKKLKTSLGDGATGFENMAKKAVSFLAMLGSTFAVKQFIQQTIESNSQLYRFAQAMDESVDSISAWRNATRAAGGDAKDFDILLGMVNQTQVDLRLGVGSPNQVWLNKLGVDIGAFTDTTRDKLEVIKDLADRFKSYAQRFGTPMAMGVASHLGISPDMARVLIQGRKALEDYIKSHKSDELPQAQAALEDQIRKNNNELENSFKALGNKIQGDADPAIISLQQHLKELITWCKDNKEFVEGFLVTLATGISLVALACLPFSGIALAIMGVATAIGWLYEDYQKWKKGSKDTIIDWDKWEPVLKNVGKGIKDLTALFTDDNGLNKALKDFVQNMDDALDRLAKFIDKKAGPKGQSWADWWRSTWVGGTLDKIGGGVLDKMGINKYRGEPGEGDGKPPVPPKPGKYSDRQKDAMSYFMSQGWTKAQAAGLVGNIRRESGFTENTWDKNHTTYGIAQWDSTRRAEFEKVFGHSIIGSSYEEQLAFMQWELENTEKKAADALRKQTTARGSATSVVKNYERSKNQESDAEKSGGYAEGAMAVTPDLPTPPATPDPNAKTGTENTGPAPQSATPPPPATPDPNAKTGTENTGPAPQSATPPPPATQSATPPPPAEGKPGQDGKVYYRPPAVLSGVPGATSAAQGAGASTTATSKAAASSQQVTDSSDRSVETHIGSINVHTAATDADGIARDMGKATNFLFTSQANYGLA